MRTTDNMTFDEYQAEASLTALYTDSLYPIVSLMVEAAELSDLFIKPHLRGDEGEIDVSKVISEAGDVLWNLAMLLDDFGVDFSVVAESNLEKLRKRREQGTIKGNGGDR